MPKPISCLIIIVSLFWACNQSIGHPTQVKKNEAKIEDLAVNNTDGKTTTDRFVFNQHVIKIRKYAAANGYANQYAFLVDLAIHSGTNRFFVVDLKTGKTITSGLVTHGCSTKHLQVNERRYANIDGSLCSSLGKYKIGEKYIGKFGVAYKLFGLDATNNHAYARSVVLHSHPYVPNTEKKTAICQSWGCPTVSPNFLKTLAAYIDASNKPILLDIFDSN